MTEFWLPYFFFVVLWLIICLHFYLKSSAKQRVILSGKDHGFDNANDQVVRTAVVQFIESAEVMSSSRVIQTIIGRAEFMEEALSVLTDYKNKNQRRYLLMVQKGVDDYRFSYYDRKIPQWIFDCLQDPQGFGYYSFYARSLFAGFIRHYKEQMFLIPSLKRESAIKRRCLNLQGNYKEFMKRFNRDWNDKAANNFKNRCLPYLRQIGRSITQMTP